MLYRTDVSVREIAYQCRPRKASSVRKEIFGAEGALVTLELEEVLYVK